MLFDKLKHLLNHIGEGIINPVPYDTAIVGWIPQSDNKFEPQFPECIEWLRRNQLPDGSWGTHRPTHTYGNIVSTLAAVIAIAKWSDSESDLITIFRGETALHQLVRQIASEEYETIGYEILLPMLLSEAKSLELRIPYKELENRSLFEEKFQSIARHQRNYGWTRKHSFWYSLEMVLGLKDLDQIIAFTPTSQLIEHNGSVCGSPSASAFYLMANRWSTKTYDYLMKLVSANSGGMPALSPSDTFELSWGLSALLMAGMS